MKRPMSAYGTKRTWAIALHMSAFGGKADITANSRHHAPDHSDSLIIMAPTRLVAEATSRPASPIRGRIRPEQRLNVTPPPYDVLDLNQRTWLDRIIKRTNSGISSSTADNSAARNTNLVAGHFNTLAIVECSVMRNQIPLAPDKPFPVDQIELEILGYDFADEALELAATASTDKAGNITLYYYYCTALYFSPRPLIRANCRYSFSLAVSCRQRQTYFLSPFGSYLQKILLNRLYALQHPRQIPAPRPASTTT